VVDLDYWTKTRIESTIICEKIDCQKEGMEMTEKKELPVGRDYSYYVHPKDTPTNDFLAPRMDEAGDKPCSLGKELFMYTTRDHNVIAHIQRSRLDKNLNFLVFIQEGTYGKINLWPYDATHPRQKSKPRKQVA